jgi:PAS domain S-box-containing protein
MKIEKQKTKRKQAGNSILKDELYLKAILSSIQSGVIVIDADKHEILDVNETATKLIGHTKEQIIGKFCHDYICPAEKGKCPITDLKQNIDNAERTLIDSNGKKIPIIKTVVPLTFQNHAYLLESFIDITERKESEDSLREQEEHYRTLFNAITDALFVHKVHEDGTVDKFIEANTVACERLGYTRQELLSMSPYDIDAPDSDVDIKPFSQRILAGESVTFEQTHITKDNRRIPVEIHAQLFKLSSQPAVLSLARDVTERKKSEEEIMKALSLLNSTIESTADGILVVDREGKIERFNQKFVQMWNIPKSIVESRNDNKALSFVLDQLENPESFLSKVKELYDHPDEKSFDVITFKDGRYFERYSQPQEIEGKILGRVWSFRDVTDRKKAEDRLKKSEKELQKRVKELEEFYDMAVGRELRMKQLKEENEELKEALIKHKKS